MNSLKILSNALLLLCLPFVATAADGDFDKKISVTASRNYADGIKKILVYERDVQISQGTLSLSADRVEINASQNERVFTATGHPVQLRQKLNDGTWIKAQANEIKYFENKRLVIMKGDAQIEQNGSIAKGDTIQYDLQAQRLMATAKDSNGRVTTIFEPSKIKDEAKKPTDSQPTPSEGKKDKGGN
ncbi:lipopolysaccharide transport periplasmic protein LptA [Gallaecimonas mangrovi]|uniref:lipopolysaccharide transport periplasmic protein LptA n=1 Tax=Gallaecimonas mangrovi TaxID=2291597 RepID=UPI000E205318|nr:lipopolysaccharide transport periplasmic protein LptA [Gallaecimonas mangrovi]